VKDPHRARSQRQVLSAHVDERVLARAAELDAAQRNAVEIANLRAAAVEAGISASAFDSALEELREREQSPAAYAPRRRPRIRALILGIAALIVAGAITITRVGQSPAAPIVEEAFVLRCLLPGEAAEVIRPMLEPTATIVISPRQAPRVLTVRTTPDQMSDVRVVVDQQDGAACRPPVTTR
jgi:hypothetical protein